MGKLYTLDEAREVIRAEEIAQRVGKGAASAEVTKLNKMAEERARETGENFFKAYDAVIQTPQGKALYNIIVR